MNKLVLVWIVMSAFTSGFAQSVYDSQEQLTAVTYVTSEDKKLSPRIQVRAEDNLVKVEAFYLPHLPKNFRGVKITTPKDRISRKDMKTLAASSFDSTYRLTELTSDKKWKRPIPSVFEKQKELFLDGRNAQPYLRHQWVQLAQVRGALVNGFSFRMKRFLQKPLIYKVDYLPSAFAYRFPAIDSWNCENASQRIFALRKLQGYGIRILRSNRYPITEREIRRKSFEIYFRRNETVPDQSGVNEIIEYLKKNDYVIMKAEMQGAASIEGSAARNQQLQKERAAVIQKLFKAYNDSPVREDTIILLDNFAPFREQIRNSQYTWLDTLVNASLQKRINEDVLLMKNLEPYLKSQRKATLKLIMTKKNSMEEQLHQMEDAIARLMRTLSQNKSPEGEMQASLMGAIDHLMELYKREQVNGERVSRLINSSPNVDFLNVLVGYYFLKQFEAYDQKKQTVQWKAFWEKFKVKSWLDKAQQSAVALADRSADRVVRLKYVKMCVDFQAYSYRFVEMELMDWNELCEVPYTTNPIFTGLRLNQYAFLYEMSQRRAVSCFPQTTIQVLRKDTIMNADQELEKIKTEIGIRPAIVIGDRLLLKPSFDTTPKNVYYELLKSYYVKGDKQIMEWVDYADGGKPELNVFNLFHLASLSVNAFDPFQNHYYDPEVQLLEMDKLIAQLKKIDTYICRPQINTLYLDYHLKALYYLHYYFEPGDERLTKIAEGSLGFIADYYKHRPLQVSPSLARHVVWQLNQFNILPGTRSGASYGYEILNAVAAKRMLQGQELKLYAHYIKMYNPDLKPSLPKLYEKEMVMKLAEESFK